MSSAETITCEMARNEKRAVIKYLNLKGLTLNEISSDMKVVLGDDAPSYTTIHLWIAEFQHGRELTEDAHRSGHPLEARREENVQCVNDMIMTDRRLTVRYVAECVNV